MPQGRNVFVRAGDTILDAALDNGIELAHECGGNCACTTCHVHILAGAEHLSKMEDVEADRLTSAENLASESRLGCQAIVRGGAVTARIMEHCEEARNVIPRYAASPDRPSDARL